jgi:hypothetical protein
MKGRYWPEAVIRAGKKKRNTDGKLFRQSRSQFLYLKKNGRLPGPFSFFFLYLFS